MWFFVFMDSIFRFVDGLFKSIIKLLLLVVMVVGLVYAGACSWENYQASQPAYATPKAEVAQYSFRIRNTGNIVLSNEYSQVGNVIGKRTFNLKTFWELWDNKFILRKTPLKLEEANFGVIDVRKRA